MKKAQFAIEYLIVSGFALFVLLISVSAIYIYYSDSRDVFDADQIDKITAEIRLTSSKVYNMGEPAKATLQLYFPTGIDDICVGGIKSEGTGPNCLINGITFNMAKSGESAVYADNKVLMDPNHLISTDKGLRNIVVEAKDDLLKQIPGCDPSNCPTCLPLTVCDKPQPGVLIYEK